ncbi:MAG: hypothetical protein ACYDDF_03410 [Thermoplasmatota archaeon]
MASSLERLRTLVEQFTEAEFQQAWAVLRAESDRRRRAAMLSFREGDRVWFEDHRGARVSGTVGRVNAKTVTVWCGDGVQWRVAPQLLQLEGGVNDPGRGLVRPNLGSADSNQP